MPGGTRLVRILHVIATLDPAGAERQMAHLCRRLDRREFQPAVCCLTRGGALEESLRAAGVPVTILHKRGRWDLRVLGRLSDVIRQFQPQIVHTWLPTANTLGRIAARRCHVPMLIASERAADRWKGPLHRMADRFLARRTNRIITNSEAVRDFLTGRIGLPKPLISVIHNGLDIAEFDAASERLSAPLPSTDGKLVVGSVGRLEPQKGYAWLLPAMCEVRATLPQAQLWIAGAGPEAPALGKQMKELGLTGALHFLGPRDDVPALMRRFDLFVLPSLWEGLPNAALEAMAARRAVVATDVDGTPEAVLDGSTGLLVPARDSAALAQSIIALLTDEARRRRYGEAGRQRVEREFGMERMVSQTEAIYRDALKEAGL